MLASLCSTLFQILESVNLEQTTAAMMPCVIIPSVHIPAPVYRATVAMDTNVKVKRPVLFFFCFLFFNENTCRPALSVHSDSIGTKLFTTTATLNRSYSISKHPHQH